MSIGAGISNIPILIPPTSGDEEISTAGGIKFCLGIFNRTSCSGNLVSLFSTVGILGGSEKFKSEPGKAEPGLVKSPYPVSTLLPPENKLLKKLPILETVSDIVVSSLVLLSNLFILGLVGPPPLRPACLVVPWSRGHLPRGRASCHRVGRRRQ